MNIYDYGILAVDDEQVILDLISEELNEAGFKHVMTAKSGLQCIEKLNEQGDNIVIILMDIRMEGMNGIETVQHITNHYDGVVGIIFHTAYANYKLESTNSGLGNENVLNLDFIVKSADLTALLASLKANIPRVLEKRHKLITSSNLSLLKKIENLHDEMSFLKKEIVKLNKKIPSFWTDVGKQILITIILALFVFAIFRLGIADLIKAVTR